MNESLAPVELTDHDTGVYLVTTASGSVYRFDLNSNTVERIGGDLRPPAAPSDGLAPLRSIVLLRLGEPGRWWVRNLSGGYTDPSEVWQSSSKVTRIEKEEGVADAATGGLSSERISELRRFPTTPITRTSKEEQHEGPA